MNLFQIVIIILIALSVCACLYSNKESFSPLGSQTYYCPSRTTERTKGKALAYNKPLSSEANSIENMQQACTKHPQCSFFTCDPKSKNTLCDKGQLYAKGKATLRLPKQQMMYARSNKPCNNYCFSYLSKDTQGRKLPHTNTQETHTVQQAKDMCDQHLKCSFFTCDTPTSNTAQICKNLNMYTTDGNVRSLPTTDKATTEMYEKTNGACSTSVPSTHAHRNAIEQAFTRPSSYTVHGGLAKYSTMNSQLLTESDQLPLRKCTSYMDEHNQPVLSEANNDSNCFLNDRETKVANTHTRNNLGNYYSRNKPYSFFKDSNHNVFMRKTDTCCAPDVEIARARVKRSNNRQLIELTENHPCQNLSDSVFSENCNRLCKNSNHVYRSDLQACIPKRKKCWFKNSTICNINSPFRNDFNQVCSTQPCRDNACRRAGKTTDAHACKDGHPYYTYVGNYNDMVAVEERLKMLERDMNTESFIMYVIIDPQNDQMIGHVDRFVPRQKLISLEKKDSNNNIRYKVLSLSPSMQYIEMHNIREPSNKTRHYIIEKHNLLDDLQNKVKDNKTIVNAIKRNQTVFGEITDFNPRTKQLTIQLDATPSAVQKYTLQNFRNGFKNIIIRSQNQPSATTMTYSLQFKPKT